MRRFIAWCAAWLELQVGIEVRRLRDEVIPKLESEVEVLKLENEKLSALAQRDLKRVEAETAVHARKIVENEQ